MDDAMPSWVALKLRRYTAIAAVSNREVAAMGEAEGTVEPLNFSSIN
jgi:hypothetical protein